MRVTLTCFEGESRKCLRPSVNHDAAIILIEEPQLVEEVLTTVENKV